MIKSLRLAVGKRMLGKHSYGATSDNIKRGTVQTRYVNMDAKHPV